MLELDLSYSTTLGALHVDFTDRARELEQIPGSLLVVVLPSREDLALTKLGRLSEADISDILTLMSSEDASWELLETLTAEAEKYYAGPADLTQKLAYVIRHRGESGS